MFVFCFGDAKFSWKYTTKGRELGLLCSLSESVAGRNRELVNKTFIFVLDRKKECE